MLQILHVERFAGVKTMEAEQAARRLACKAWRRCGSGKAKTEERGST
jgi:hypothetical protein